MDPHHGPKDDSQSRGALLKGTGVALLVALAVLVLAVLPAEYSVDPTGFGAWAGLTTLSGTQTVLDPTLEGGNREAEASQGKQVTLYEALWPVTTSGLGAYDGYTHEGGTSNVTVPAAMDNLTTLTATLTWNDDNATAGQLTRPDLFELRIIGPDGRAEATVLGRNSVGSPGVITATLPWRSVPAPLQTEAATSGDARTEFATVQPTDPSARGEWRVLVTLLEAGDGNVTGVPVPAGPGPAGDHGNTWTLTVTADTYALDVRALPGVGLRRDTASFTLKPGDALEYKLAMKANVTLDYAWSTSGSDVFYDFHGDVTDTTGFARHKAGTAAGDAAAFRIPFEGRHGWYWRNTGDVTTTITLETRGPYTVIGKV